MTSSPIFLVYFSYFKAETSYLQFYNNCRQTHATQEYSQFTNHSEDSGSFVKITNCDPHKLRLPATFLATCAGSPEAPPLDLSYLTLIL